MTAEPQICTLCLGDSPSTVRMTRVPLGAQCRVCTLPFTLYHFKPSARSHTLVKTVLCPGCASQRDVCQCCMRDMQWHVSIEERDQIVALVQGDDTDTTTPAARNSMMKRFLARKGGKLGGAKVTGDAAALAELVERMRGSIARIEGELQEESEESKGPGDSDRLASVDISKILARLPLSQPLTADTHTRSFLLYNIPQTLPEWRVGDAVARVAGAADWRDGGTDSLVVNHRAGAGGVRFASDALADAFVAGLLRAGEVSAHGHGVLRVDQFRVHVAPWRGGFSAGSFGGSRDAQAKLCVSLRRFVAMGGAKGSSGVDTKAAGRVGKRNKGRGAKGSKGRRATSLEL
ncbi:Ecm2 protein [Maudiozyma humilis]|uniref:Pre-mRNA-splicing factor SLT11 n=1 Tax=Maudiozyma humilis TaxID=51915 RepID=A0AAV5RVU8_MAUHU|nr:Ecm2 protein [Kazachstania humilis]